MSAPDTGRTTPEGLTTSEGVDEGSAASTVEGPASGEQGSGGETGVVGEAPRGAPETEEQAAGPVDVEPAEARGDRAGRGPGQQLEAGEG